jgi:hypothetical protein
MINFDWNITDIDVVDIGDQTNVVRSFKWTLIASLDGQTSEDSSEYFASSGLESSSVDNFKEFNTLTKELCVAWVKKSLGIELDKIKEELSRQVKTKVSEAAKNIVAAPW